MSADPSQILAALVARNETLAVCESLTGGALGAAFTAVPGSSAVFRGGLLTYAADLKTTLAGVPASLIAEHGVVSRAVAEAMANGVRRVCGATWGIATTGVAGPDPVDEHPPGEVWIAVAGPDDRLALRLFRFGGDRFEVRSHTVAAAIRLLSELAME